MMSPASRYDRVAAQEELGLLIADFREVEAVEVRRQDRLRQWSAEG